MGTRRGPARARGRSAPVLRRRGRDPSPADAQLELRGCTDYAEWYRSQHPADPRLPPPILTTDTCLAVMHAAAERYDSMQESPASRSRSASPAHRGVLASPSSSKAALGRPAPPCRPPLPGSQGCSEKSSGATAAPTGRRDSGRSTEPGLSSSSAGGQPVTAPASTAHCGAALSPHARPFVPARQLQTQAQEVALSTAGNVEVQSPAGPQRPGSGGSRPPQQPQQPVSARRSSEGAPRLSAADLRGRAAEVCADPDGCRQLQRLVDSCPRHEVDAVFDELESTIGELAADPAGAHIVQRLLERGSQRVITGAAAAVRGRVGDLARQTYGCRMLQRVLEVASEETRRALMAELEAADLYEDANGSHVVQKCLEVMPELSTPLVRAVAQRVSSLSCHPYGCRVVQRVLEHCRESSHIVPILEDVLRRAHALVSDQYGNYVVQHVIANGHPQYRFAVTMRLRGHFALLSMHKFASNVVEKMYEHATQQLRDAILEELTSSTGHGSDGALSGAAAAATDQYGNYVIQKIFDLSSEEQRTGLLQHLAPFLDRIRAAPYGKHLAARLERYEAWQPERYQHQVIRQQQQQQQQFQVQSPTAPQAPQHYHTVTEQWPQKHIQLHRAPQPVQQQQQGGPVQYIVLSPVQSTPAEPQMQYAAPSDCDYSLVPVTQPHTLPVMPQYAVLQAMT
eukprot:TRINITY_DN1228_c0_g1_i2.p1 TRINITY_DN1228_c0_g1~~TRINITY_DN1228_c0_g1_i2.p1  ORF type:complete len:714 (+),score=193.52 TRINITY_DN1228_c0_g1_i2:99-2144(+)